MTRRVLLRLYPKHWRQRYGEEFGRLLEETPFSAGVVANVISAAARVRLMTTPLGWAVWAVSVSWMASVVARYLSRIYPGEDAGFLVAFVGLPLNLLFLAICVMRARVFDRGRPAVDDWQFMKWILVFFVATIASQWSDIALSSNSRTNLLTLFGSFGLLHHDTAASSQDLDTRT